jgi:DNA (cytosine-5)-methyltransferase 1
MTIPVVDLFAGPGGLGEGFSSLVGKDGRRRFKIGISIEKDFCAHQTLELRAFTRCFAAQELPPEYYEYLRGAISREALFLKHPKAARLAISEAWLAELGSEVTPNEEVDERIRKVLGRRGGAWILIGGPPCQAYSLVGRSRMIGEDASKFAGDHRHFLYKEYLRILAVHEPPIFVMENVKGLLSASHNGEKMLTRILDDLAAPSAAIGKTAKVLNTGGAIYNLHTLRPYDDNMRKVGKEADFLISSEQHGVPQNRHRLIIVGVRSDIRKYPRSLKLSEAQNIETVLSDLPKLRSGLSKENDSAYEWAHAIQGLVKNDWRKLGVQDDEQLSSLVQLARAVDPNMHRGGRFLVGIPRPLAHADWFVDDQLQGFCNHESRGHIRADIHRYFFAATFAKLNGKSPSLKNFPYGLLPLHENVKEAIAGKKFGDRFRVQCKGKPSTTVVSHIAKDGHYFIHYDPLQCRSLTVREAARLQTFPDNYFFEGPRTEQYKQVGNAVPPFLAKQIAEIVAELL